MICPFSLHSLPQHSPAPQSCLTSSSRISVYQTTAENTSSCSFILLILLLFAQLRLSLSAIGSPILRPSTHKLLLLHVTLNTLIWPGQTLQETTFCFGQKTFLQVLFQNVRLFGRPGCHPEALCCKEVQTASRDALRLHPL